MFSFISMNWKEQPPSSYEIIVNLIGSTTNESGPRVKRVLGDWACKPGITVNDEDFTTIDIERNE